MTRNQLTYLQPLAGDHRELYEYNRTPYRLQQNDILDIQVQTLDAAANKIFKSGYQQSVQLGTQQGGDPYYISGYSVSQEGTVDLPYIGPVKVSGATLEEAKAIIDSAVGELFRNYYLTVKLGGIRFAALGEFRSVGKKVLLQNQVTLFEAIALCGDMTSVADRQRLQIIRQYPDGTKIHTVNTRVDTVIGSPFYFIQPNDILYAPPLPQKSLGFGVTATQSFSLITGLLSSSVALALSITSLTR